MQEGTGVRYDTTSVPSNNIFEADALSASIFLGVAPTFCQPRSTD